MARPLKPSGGYPGASGRMTVVSLSSLRRGANQRRRAPQIIEAAARVFAERGFHGATTQDIADALGIRQASLYYYFSSKELALELVCLKGVEGFLEAGKAIAAGLGSARERLILLINSHLSPLIDRRDFVKVFLNERQHLPAESRRRIGRWSRGLERIFEDVIKEGMAKGEFRADLDPRMATLAILGMCNAASSWYRKENAPIPYIAGEFVRLVIDGLGKPAAKRGPRRR
ncbi:MAG TPA: TetR/AcrR family transcriptional regulator [Bradyrhizobium sp.]|nr:TetR/AcrR family transcriptional regulator [Bradyrhizobium sp.]